MAQTMPKMMFSFARLDSKSPFERLLTHAALLNQQQPFSFSVRSEPSEERTEAAVKREETSNGKSNL